MRISIHGSRFDALKHLPMQLGVARMSATQCTKPG